MIASKVMAPPTTRGYRFFALSVAVALVGVLTASCSDDARTGGPSGSDASDATGGRSPSKTEAAGPAASEELARVQWATGFGLRVKLLTLTRTPANAVLAKFQLTSYEPDGVVIGTYFSEGNPPHQISSISLIDTKNHLRYMVLTEANGKCLCTPVESLRLEPRESMQVYAYFPEPPPDLDHMAVDFAYTNIFFHVPLSTRNDPAPLPDNQPERRPSEIQTQSEVLPVISRAFEIDGSGAVKRSGDEVQIRLAAKVLFDLNEASLRPEAREELRQVAKEIAEADPEVVHVDGYTDSSGGKQINIPLSKQRARNVKQALQRMITRNDIKFIAQGHGANNPIASNATAEGRQKNRRVTVSFNR